ncbi:WYL domain-containing protein [Streptomyces noursei]|uniref:WYL domain-containing protein n=1 Tax=Streptomyces noursei TaxID=1971 RepID=UPI00344E1F91
MPGIAPEKRLELITTAAKHKRPIRITYHGENPCDPNAGTTRVIEVHNVQASEAGNIVLDAYCHLCKKIERFSRDKITAHRALRGRFHGPQPKVSPFFTLYKRVAVTEFTRPITAHPTASGIISRAITGMAHGDRLVDLFGPRETYPRRRLAITTTELLREVREQIATANQTGPAADAIRFRSVFGDPRTYPPRPTAATADDHLAAVRSAIRASDARRDMHADFRAVFGNPDTYPGRVKRTAPTAEDHLATARTGIAIGAAFRRTGAELAARERAITAQFRRLNAELAALKAAWTGEAA